MLEPDINPQAQGIAEIEVSEEVRETAVRLGVLFRHMVSYSDGGQSLREIDEYGLSFVQFKALMELFATDVNDPPYLQKLADNLGTSMPSLSRAVDGLVRKGLVTRTVDSNDRRRRRVTLSEAGREVGNRFFRSRAAGVVNFASSLTEAQREAMDAAIGLLLEREDIAPIYQKFEGAIQS